ESRAGPAGSAVLPRKAHHCRKDPNRPMPLSRDQKAEVEALRAESQPTRRATVPALEEILYEAFPVLDHGFVRVVDYMGDDGAVVQAARVSYGRGTRKVSEDRALIQY